MLYMSRPSSPEASRLRLPPSSAPRLLGDLGRVALRHRHDAVVIGHDDVAGIDVDAGADHGDIDRAERRLHRALGRDRARPHRKVHLVQCPDVAAAGIDDQSLHAARLQRGCEQLAEHAVGVVGGAAHDEDVALRALLDRDMNHPVVAGLRQHGDGGAGDRRASPDRPQIRLHQSEPIIGLVHGRDAVLRHPSGIGTLDVANDDRLHASSSATVGNSR